MRIVLTAAALAIVLGGSAATQETVKPGPQHEVLRAHEGVWETSLKAGGMDHKGIMTYKMEVGGMWLVGSLESDLGGQKYHGKSMDSYDAKKKKYIGFWFDSMSATPLQFEGDYDQARKTLTMVADGPGIDGKLAKWRSVTEMKDHDNFHMGMYLGDGKEPMFTITYKRKK